MNSKETLAASDQVLEFLHESKAMVFHPNKTARATFTKILGDIGISANRVQLFNRPNYQEIMSYIEEQCPSIILTSNYFEQECVLMKLLELHQKVRPDRINCCYIILSEENSVAAASYLLDHEVDGYFFTPFNAQELTNNLVQIFEDRVTFSDYRKSLFKGIEAFHKKDHKSVDSLLTPLLKKEGDTSLIHAYLGKSAMTESNTELARENFKKGIQVNPHSYWCLKELMLIHIQDKDFQNAYNIAKKILENFPFNPRIVSHLIKLMVVLNKHQDILDLTDICEKLQVIDTQLDKHMAAGMIVAAHHFNESGDKEDAVNILYKALTIGYGYPNIRKQVCLVLADFGRTNEAISMLEKISDEGISDEDFINTLLKLHLCANHAQQILKIGEQLLRSDNYSLQNIEIILQGAKEFGLSGSQLDSIIESASKKYPDKAEELKRAIS